MLRFLSSLLLLLLQTPSAVLGQSLETVRNSHEYIYGEGKGATVADADRNALNDLISKISVHVSSTITSVDSNKAQGDEVETLSQFMSAVSTYSQATLHNTEKRIIQNEPDAVVARWIKRSELEKIFESRKNKIKDYVESAEKAQAKGKIDVALKDYYWAFSLLKSLQQPNDLYYDSENDGNVMLATWIPRKMNAIFENIQTEVVSREGDEVELHITYDGKPVNSIDYTYFDGRDWSNVYSAKDGVGVMELAPGFGGENCQIKFEYEFRGEAHIDREVESVLQAVTGTSMRKAYCNVKANAASGKSLAKSMAAGTYASVSKNIFKKPEPVEGTEAQKLAIERVAASIASRQHNVPADLFTSEGLEIYKELIKYGNAKTVGTPKPEFYRSQGVTYCRGMQMAFSFKNGMRKSFVEEMVFRFDAAGKIDNISFGLGKTAEDDILGKGVWDETARFAILNFLENYQTAYALKRLDYISDIFDDDAVIITAIVEPQSARKVMTMDGKGIQFGGDVVRYNRHTKDSYLKHLAHSFASKEYINLRLGGNDVRKLGKGGEMYAIQISQEYYSSNYGDKGYLFLMVDINDPDRPIIKVRTWQPEKDPNFGLYGPEHFQ